MIPVASQWWLRTRKIVRFLTNEGKPGSAPLHFGVLRNSHKVPSNQFWG